jgi:xanthine dehydrogenase accessory factor
MLVELVEDPAPYRAALALLDGGARALLVKEVPDPHGGGREAVTVLDEAGKSVHGTNPRLREATASRCLASGRPAYEEEDRLFYDPLFPEEKLLVLGGGHVGLAVAALAARLDFRVTVVDERPEFASPARFPADVRVVCGPYADAVARFPSDPATYVVIVTPGHVSDLECVRAALKKTSRYVGFIGSARKTALILAQARNDGFPAEVVDRLYAPIGLDIAAETPEEIAVSIVGELIAVRRNSRSLPAMELSRQGRRAPQGSAGR